MSLLISAATRRQFELPDEMVATVNGRLSLRIASPADARLLAHHLRHHAGTDDPSRSGNEESGASTPSAGQVNGLTVLCDILQVTLERLVSSEPKFLQRVLQALDRQLGRSRVDRLLAALATEFLVDEQPRAVSRLRGRRSDAADDSERLDRLTDLVLWRVARLNAPPGPLQELIGGRQLLASPEYEGLMDALIVALEQASEASSAGHSLLPMLRSPVLAGAADRKSAFEAAAGGRLTGEWELRARVAGEILSEEETPRFPPGPGPLELPRFDEEGEDRYADDRPWMPEVVLVAKNVRVWLVQMSRAYDRQIARLDQIPDAELDRLAGWGMSGLWLIGLWERSPASQNIKRRSGNPEAGASAYAIRAYRVAESLGGEEALADLRRRAGDRGIRIAADMVANHLAIDSDWMIDHPERFLSLPRSPFPGYSFSEPDLSPSPRCSIFLEEHYYDRSDAAVVFQRVDRQSGEVRFVYHGNDGTSVPWNDTAQLDYLNPETREAVIRTIIEVAKQVSVLRFDAAMTLTRRHYQRLWVPAPGDAGAIASRAEFGMDSESFARAMPMEFWREVVERVEREAPDTLLLAEAFWLTESFFVRHLGMHRVYNSAFMHTLRDGENGKFRELVQAMLRRDPRLLERQVNFLSNPDERTAIDQFGRGDRYFGACVVLATLPGMPMFGHGQLEGLTERYGMEYERDYHDETADAEVVARHEREIVPLLHRRRLFAGSRNFRLFSLRPATDSHHGSVDHDLLAYTNRGDGEPSLVLFNNRSTACRGRLERSTPFAAPEAGEASPNLANESLVEALGLTEQGGEFVAWRDLISGQEFLRRVADLTASGLEVDLPPFGYAVLTLFRQLDDDRGALSRLADRLQGGGIDDLVAARLRLEQEPLNDLFAFLAAPALADRLLRAGDSESAATARQEVLHLATEFLEGLAASAPGNVSPEAGVAALGDALDSLSAPVSAPATTLWTWSLLRMLAASGGSGGALPVAIWDPRTDVLAMLESTLGPQRSRRRMAALEIAIREHWHRPLSPTPSRGPRPLREWLAEPQIADLVDLRPCAGGEELNLRSLLELVDLRRWLAAVAGDRSGAKRVESIWRRRGDALRRLQE